MTEAEAPQYEFRDYDELRAKTPLGKARVAGYRHALEDTLRLCAVLGDVEVPLELVDTKPQPSRSHQARKSAK